MNIVRLGDICEIESGGTPLRSNLSYWENGNIPWVKISDINGKYLNKTEEYITELGLKNSSAKIFKKGTILYTIFATLGEVCILNIDTSTNQAIAGIRIIDNNVNTNYLYYYLLSLKLKVNNIGRGVAQNNINMKILKDFKINLPPLEEQKRIANILDKVTELIQKRKKQLDKLDLLVKAKFVEMFGEYFNNKINEKTLISLCNFIDYRGKTPQKSESGIPLITAKNVKENVFSIEPQEFIPSENYEFTMTRGIPKVNDVLFTTEAPLGNVCRIPDIYELFCVGQRIITMQPKEEKIISEYLEYALLSKEFQVKLWQKASGSTVKGIRSKLLESLTIPLPELNKQKIFAKFVEETEKSKIKVNESLKKLETLKDALMQKYFNQRG